MRDAVQPQARPKRSIGRLAIGWGLRAVAAFVAVTAAWVALYAVVAPPGTLLMAREASRLGAIEQVWRPLDPSVEHIARAVVAAEDARFCSHGGVDVDAILTALTEHQDGRRLRGASTISQQVAKNAFLWPDRSYLRKALEFWFTALVETTWSKRRIVEVYLNVAELGPGVFGVEAASRRYFGGPADRISEAQAAALAAVLPNPRRRNPAALSADLQVRADQIENGANDIAVTGAATCFGG